MSVQVTLEELKQQIIELPLQEQLKLVADIGERLSAMPLISPALESERVQMECMAQLDAWIAECEKVAELWEGSFDSAADLRRIRDEET